MLDTNITDKDAMTTDLIHLKDHQSWMRALESCGSHDTYHLPEYHFACMEYGGGKPYLFYFQEKDWSACLPIFLKPLSDVRGIEGSAGYDAVSAYGYPGAITNVSEKDKDASRFSMAFQKALSIELKRLDVVSAFFRFNPLFNTEWIMKGLGEVIGLGPTVALDLTNATIDANKGMTVNYRASLRQNILKAKKNNVSCFEDKAFAHLSDFIRMYKATMLRVNASDFYIFPDSYFKSMRNNLGGRLKLYFVQKDGQLLGGALFFLCCGIIQYHLSGTVPEGMRHSGAAVILETVHRWGAENGYRRLHLGGGVGSQKDSLLAFKSGFNKAKDSFLQYSIVKMIVDRAKYNDLIRKKQTWLNRNGGAQIDETYFPIYRAPIIDPKS